MKRPKNTALTTVSWLFLYLVVLWLAALFSMNYESGMSILALFPKMAQALADPFTLSFNEYTPAFVAVFSLLYGVGVAAWYSSYGKRRIGEEHGSASWTSPRAVNKLFAQDRRTDRVLTQHVRMGLDEYKHRRNLNALIIGGSGAGKTRGYALPNIMQANSSFIVTDAKGEIIRSVGNLLVSEGYEIKVLDLINFHNSDRYNPFRYIKEEKDVIKLINNLHPKHDAQGSTNVGAVLGKERDGVAAGDYVLSAHGSAERGTELWHGYDHARICRGE